ncbi:antibiotic biosynthesis monooxygenase [Dokdonia pacifica]|uniref:Heme-degrading monooxygenase HmoA n=1 Tax=Dokdonia pacifica TaxID=1627892 RepID=A0A238W2J7_9FLAO|nr:antibiotic biosynthesis monooxygenase [Dokdonia pacifica]GGG15596.1 antibiotic biosynthesis monooxygenase [Dokdonia pacifica]SNR40647.1 Heme-degrading monooxygenase HmoA [Dokdonia pacifica]
MASQNSLLTPLHKELPYYAVVFASTQTSVTRGYSLAAQHLEELAQDMPGYLGIDHARNEVGITISYWKTLEDIARWKAQTDHQAAQAKGKSTWYEAYTIRICKVERHYDFSNL